jgi:HAE1 family hydrophobic/amphiphilic exporter-1
MLVGTAFGLLLVPGLYVIFAGMIKEEKPAEPATEEVTEEEPQEVHA